MTQDIHIDIVGFIFLENVTYIAFVECKNDYIKLRDLSQVIGYSLIAKPKHSFITDVPED